MFRRWLPGLAAVVLVSTPVLAPAADPTLIVRVGSIDGLLADAQFLADLAGRGEQVAQFQKFLQVQIGPKGLDGIDTRRPLGLYGTINADDPGSSRVVALVPVADETAFTDLLERLNLKAVKDADGVYSLQRPAVPVPVYFRFANKHVYVTIRDRGAIDKAELLDPARVLPPGGTGVASASLRLDQVPNNLKQLLLSRLDLGLADLIDKERPGESAAERAFRVQTIREVGKQLTAIVRDGQDVNLRLDLDRAGEQMAVELTLAGKSGSALAESIASYGQGRNVLSGAVGSQAALNGLAYYSLPDGLRKAWEDLIDHGIRTALEKETDAGKKALQEKVFQALAPTLKAGVLDAGVEVRGPNDNKLYTLVGGVRLKDGLALDRIVRATVPQLPAGDQARIKLDADSAGNARIHQFQLPEVGRQARQLVGESPTLFIAIREDAAFFALGEDGLAGLKAALTAGPKATPQVQVELSLKRIALAMARDNPRAVTAAQEAFAADGKDRVQVLVEGGDALKVRFVVSTPVVKFVSQLAPPE